MKFEVLKKSHLKRNIIIGLVVVVVIAAIVINFTRAKYRTTQTLPLINGTVNYAPYDFKMVAMYQENDSGEYVSIDTVPTSGYALNEENSYCEVDDTQDDNIKIQYTDGKINFLGMTFKGTKCYLYFDEQASIKDTLLAYYPTILTRTDFSTTVTSTTTGTIYKSADSSQYDDDGEVYYFAGNPTDNWVSFAGFYWRIVRFNGDGSIRLIYSGDGSAQTTGTETQIGTSAFNSKTTNNMYVGYMYTSGNTHETGTSSTIKGVLDNWYLINIQNAGYSSYVDATAGFCNDRTPYSGTGRGTTQTYYGAYNRLYTNKSPTFECSDEENDLFTVSSSDKGNQALTYPIGLITADEVTYAGGVSLISNNSYYLYNNQTYWTITPCRYSDAVVFVVWRDGALVGGNLDASYVNDTLGIRPVINLRADVTISSGNGTQSTPFVIATT